MSGVLPAQPKLPTVDGSGVVAFEVDLTLFDFSAVLRTCYKFTDRCWLFLSRTLPESPVVTVTFRSRRPGAEPLDLAGDLANELIDQQIREALAREVAPLREMVVAHAFAQGNLLDPARDDGDYSTDPLGIAEARGSVKR